jgi:hypothetical protein
MPKGKVAERECPTRNFNGRHQFAARFRTLPSIAPNRGGEQIELCSEAAAAKLTRAAGRVFGLRTGKRKYASQACK